MLFISKRIHSIAFIVMRFISCSSTSWLATFGSNCIYAVLHLRSGTHTRPFFGRAAPKLRFGILQVSDCVDRTFYRELRLQMHARRMCDVAISPEGTISRKSISSPSIVDFERLILFYKASFDIFINWNVRRNNWVLELELSTATCEISRGGRPMSTVEGRSIYLNFYFLWLCAISKSLTFTWACVKFVTVRVKIINVNLIGR